MAIVVQCPECAEQFRAADSASGKASNCPKCKVTLTISGERVPDFDVFLSHSSQDVNAAHKVLHVLEENDFRCWIAPRDIKGGANWGSSIVEAIGNSRVMVLIYSEHANFSPQVLREVERAVAKQVVLIPFRIDSTPMTSDFEYFLSTSHWLDALNGPSEAELNRLLSSLTNLIRPAEPKLQHSKREFDSSHRRATKPPGGGDEPIFEEPSTGTITIKRPFQLAGAIYGYDIKIDGVSRGNLKVGKTLTFEVSAGKHQITAKCVMVPEASVECHVSTGSIVELSVKQRMTYGLDLKVVSVTGGRSRTA